MSTWEEMNAFPERTREQRKADQERYKRILLAKIAEWEEAERKRRVAMNEGLPAHLKTYNM